MRSRILEHVSLVALSIGFGTVVQLIDPPTWPGVLVIPFGLALGAAHNEVWARFRERRIGR